MLRGRTVRSGLRAEVSATRQMERRTIAAKLRGAGQLPARRRSQSGVSREQSAMQRAFGQQMSVGKENWATGGRKSK